MARKSDKYIHAETNRIRRVLEEADNIDKKDLDIIEQLQIKPATFYHYKAKIRKQDQALWDEMAKETMKERSAKIMKSIQFAQKIFKGVALHSSDDRAKIEAAKNVIQADVWAKELLEKGPKVMIELEAKINESIPKSKDTTVESLEK